MSASQVENEASLYYGLLVTCVEGINSAPRRTLDDVAAVRAVAPAARIVGFGPHVDGQAAEKARDSGADEVLARSRFFHDPAGALRT